MKNNINSTNIVAYSDNKPVIEPDIRAEPLMIDTTVIECGAHSSPLIEGNDSKEDLKPELIKVTRLDSVKKPDKFCEKMISEISEEITGDSLKESSKKCRELAAIKQQDAQKAEAINEEDDDFEATQAQATKSKREYDDLKKTLPSCCFNGIFKGKVTNKSLIGFSGLAAIDIDKLEKQELEEARKKITSLDSCAICYTTPSGLGLKACIWVGELATRDDVGFKTIFAKLEQHFSETHKITLDPACKDIRRLHFLAHDPNAHINYKALAFDLDSVVLKENSINRPNADSEGFKLFECTRIRTAIQSIHPDGITSSGGSKGGDYQLWLEMGMAIHHASQGAKIGFDLWDEWSQDSNSYDQSELSTKWASFSNRKNDITIGTLFKKSGYKGEWPDLDEPDVREWIKREKAHNISKFNKYYAFIDLKGKAFIVYRVRTKEGLVMTNMSKWQDFKTLNNNIRIPDINYKTKKPKLEIKPFTTIWENSPTRRQYQGAEFEPFPGVDFLGIALPEGTHYNDYTGLSISPSTGECDLIFDHIQHTLCKGSREGYEYVLNWIARMFQDPNKQGETALVFRSKQGAGKGVILERILQKTFANHSVVFSDSRQLIDNFNGLLASSIYVYSNEAIWGGEKSYVGPLKALITDRTLIREDKFMPKSIGSNCTHLIITSNEEWVIPTDVDDRRFVMFDVCNGRIGDHQYFKALVNQIDNGGREAFSYAMLNRDITNFNPAERPVIDSQLLIDQKILGSCSIDQWWYECLQEERVLGPTDQGDTPNFAENWHEQSITPLKEEIAESFENWCRGKPGQHPVSKNALTKHLCENYKGVDGRLRRNKKWTGQKPAYKIPKLEVCRKIFSDYMNLTIPWSEPEIIQEEKSKKG